MKRLFCILLTLITISISASIPDINGVWENGKVELTFKGDSVYIDEIGNEGDIYTYSLDTVNNIISIMPSPDPHDWFAIKIVSSSADSLSYYFMDDPKMNVFTFKKKKIQIPTMGY